VNTGFAIRGLTVTGPGKADATVAFTDGLNVISGPSDTGKSYILQCIDFALGAGRPPRAIDAAAGYTAVRLTIEGRVDGVLRTLTRSLGGGASTLLTPRGDSRELRAKHKDGDVGTTSGYLLELSGLTGLKVRTDKSGTTRGLSFRDIAPLVVISEQAVISEDSPVRGRRQDTETVELRVFRLLLTGEDDSAVVAEAKPAQLRLRQSGQADILEQLLQDLRAERGHTIAVIEDLAAGERRLAELDEAAIGAGDALSDQQQAAVAMEERRRPAWTQLRHTESRLQVLRELQIRFELLEEQYRSDLRRLEAIAEAGGRLEQLEEGRCSVCGALAAHHDPEHAEGHATAADVALASRAEAAKILMLLRDLETTLAANSDDIAALTMGHRAQTAALQRIDDEIDAQLRPRLAALTRAVRQAERELHRHARALELSRREQHLQQLLATARGPVAKRASKPDFGLAGASSAEAEPFARKVEDLLRSWHFPELERVTFSDEAQDVVVSGQARGARGKGVRALTHAAFTLALLRLSLDHRRPHPGLAVIDSPLVVYTEPDTSEQGFSPAVKDAFYLAVARDFADAQVIVLENQSPPTELAGTASRTHFTKADHGRYGFFPVS
jgi:AAA domain